VTVKKEIKEEKRTQRLISLQQPEENTTRVLLFDFYDVFLMMCAYSELKYINFFHINLFVFKTLLRSALL
jgi:hypothetical protein